MLCRDGDKDVVIVWVLAFHADIDDGDQSGIYRSVCRSV